MPYRLPFFDSISGQFHLSFFAKVRMPPIALDFRMHSLFSLFLRLSP